MHAVRLQGAILTLGALVIGGTLAACGAGQPKPGTVLDEAMRAKRTAASFPAADEDYFHDMDGGAALHEGGGPGPQHVDGLDRRQRPALGRAGRPEPRLARLPEDAVVASDAALLPRHRWNYLGPRERALLHEGRPVPIRTGTGCGSTCAIRRAGPIRSRTPRSTRASGRRARQDRAGRLLLRRAHRHRRPSAVPQPGLRRGGARKAGTPSATTATRATTSAATW